MTRPPEARHLRSQLLKLVGAVERVLLALEKVRAGPSTLERGKQIAAIANHLELHKDMAVRFGLYPEKPAGKKRGKRGR